MTERQRRISRILAEIRSQSNYSESSVVDGGRLLGVPEPIAGEAFSSWCWRTSIEHGCSTSALLRQLAVEVPAFWVDAGRGNLDLPRISAMVMQPIRNLYTFQWSQDSLLSATGLACLTTVPLLQRPIYRYCENCLRGDNIPHIRLLWRQACAYICPVHGSVLRDVCPHCQVPFALPKHQGKRTGGAPSIRDCRHCGKDVSACGSAHLPQEFHYYVLGRQTELLGLIGANAGRENTRQVAQLHTNEKVLVGAAGIIDVNLTSNQQFLFQYLVANRLLNRRDGSTVATNYSRLEQYLLKIDIRTNAKDIVSLAIGFDGRVLFGEMSRFIAVKYLYGIQDICGSTFWWPFGRGNPFQAGEQPVATDAAYRRAVNWAEKCGTASFDRKV